MRLYVTETYAERKPEPDGDHKLMVFGDSGPEPYETFTDDIGKLYKSLQREYGRCEGHVYRDGADGTAVPIGWVFLKRMRYEDARGHEPSDYYLREVWVEVHAKPDHVRTERESFLVDVSTGKPAKAGAKVVRETA